MAANVIGRRLLQSIRSRSYCLMNNSRNTGREVIPVYYKASDGSDHWLQHMMQPDLCSLLPTPNSQRSLYTNTHLLQNQSVMDIEDVEQGDDGEVEGVKVKKGAVRQVVDVQTSIEYMKSEAFRITYGDALIWEPYRRNHKGSRPRHLTRKTCIRGGVLATGNPCPICRDEYLTIDPKHPELLKHFISPKSGQVISFEKTGICQVQHKKLLIAVHQAWDKGYLEIPLAQRRYDYSDYYPEIKKHQGR